MPVPAAQVVTGVAVDLSVVQRVLVNVESVVVARCANCGANSMSAAGILPQPYS